MALVSILEHPVVGSRCMDGWQWETFLWSVSDIYWLDYTNMALRMVAGFYLPGDDGSIH